MQLPKQEDITPEFIIEAAKEFGISLKPNVYRNVRLNCGCPVAILALVVYPDMKSKMLVGSWACSVLEKRGLESAFLFGIVRGFDGFDTQANKPIGYQNGLKLGRDIRKRVDTWFAAQCEKAQS